MLKSNGGERWRTSKLRFHTAEVAGSIPASPTPKISRFAALSHKRRSKFALLFSAFAATVQQRSDDPTSGVRNTHEPWIGPIPRVAFILLSPEDADQGNGNKQ
jgi:hypothetical protein